MTLSLNEMEATAKRATRGAGYCWGQAEEAAKATRWLCSQGLDGGAELAELLEQDLAGSVQKHVPAEMDGPWRGEAALCPLMAGATLSDRADALRHGAIDMRQIASPLMILPFAANAARSLACLVTVETENWTAITDGCALTLTGDLSGHADRLSVRIGGTLSAPRVHRSRAAPDPAHWAVLNRFAHRTYAPATEESRLLGAGAGLSDND